MLLLEIETKLKKKKYTLLYLQFKKMFIAA
jgi:hypothetical protein